MYVRKEHIGISTNIFKNPKEAASLVSDLGKNFKSIEIEFENDLRELLDGQVNERKKVVEQLLQVKKEQDLYYSVHGPYRGAQTDIASTSAVDRARAVSYMKKTIDLAHELGASLFTCHPGYLGADKQLTSALIDSLESSISELSEHAKNYGMTVLLENTGDTRPRYILLNNVLQQELCETYGIGITMDLVHFTSFNPMEENYFEALNVLLPYIQNVHFADMNMPVHAHLPLGVGNFDYRAVIDFFYRENYQGYVIVEETGMRYPSHLYVERAIAFKNTISDVCPIARVA